MIVGVCIAGADGEAVIFSVIGRVRGLAVICNPLGNKYCLIGSRIHRLNVYVHQNAYEGRSAHQIIDFMSTPSLKSKHVHVVQTNR